ncbi:MAG: ParB N-terminal domain-containing protein [Acidobacteriia bacterium]|nr:ParB N-terminal domain-containing protein [Terriglobia bacterium]
MGTSSAPLEILIWPIDRFIFYARNPRKNDAAVDRMCGSIREYGLKIPVLARSDGEVVDGHLRLKAARKLGSWPGGDTSGIPVILCDEWTPQQVKAFRLMVNRSVAWADWDEDLLALELQELSEADFDLSLTGFNPGEIDALLAIPDEEKANEAPPPPAVATSRPGDLWLCGKSRRPGAGRRPERKGRLATAPGICGSGWGCRHRTARPAENVRQAVPRGWRRTGADSIATRPRFGAND